MKATCSREKEDVLKKKKKKKRRKTTLKSGINWINGEGDLRTSAATLVNAGLEEAAQSANTQQRGHGSYNRSMLFYISVSKQNINSSIAWSAYDSMKDQPIQGDGCLGGTNFVVIKFSLCHSSFSFVLLGKESLDKNYNLPFAQQYALTASN